MSNSVVAAVVVGGREQREGLVTHVIVSRLEALPRRVLSVEVAARNFR